MQARSGPERHRQLRQWVADRLRAEILEGRRRPGDWLRQESVAREEGVSQTPVREALKQLVAAKTKVLPFSQAIMEASYKASMEMFAENDAKSPEWRKIYADMRAFQRDQVLWFRFAEASFDGFMFRQKL